MEEEETIVRVISNIGESSTRYRKAAQRPRPFSSRWHYKTSERNSGRSWFATTISNVIYQPAYRDIYRMKSLTSSPPERCKSIEPCDMSRCFAGGTPSIAEERNRRP